MTLSSLVARTTTAIALAIPALAPTVQAQAFLNVSYDPTHDLYHDVDETFTAFWTDQGHGGPHRSRPADGSDAQGAP